MTRPTAVRSSAFEDALALGERSLLEDGDLAQARPRFDAAARAALSSGDTHALARAALGLGGLWVHEHRTAVEAARIEAWQRRSLEALDPASQLARRLATRIAAESNYRRGTSSNILAQLERARADGDPVVLADALNLAHHCLLGPEHAALRLELAEELLAVAALTGRRADERLGLLWRTVDLLLRGDPHAERSLQELRMATQHHPFRAVDFVLSGIDVMLAIRRGDLSAAERQAQLCAADGREVGDADCLGYYGAHLVAIRWYQDRPEELLSMLTELVHSPTLTGVNDSFYAALAVAAASAGDRSTAAGALHRLRRQGFAGLPSSSTWLVSLFGVIEAANLLDDRDTAAEAYALLEPFAALPVMVSLGVVCFGSAQHALGVAALTMRDLERAAHHLHAAVFANEALGHRPALELSMRRLEQVRRLRRSSEYELAASRASMRRHGGNWRIELGQHTVVVHDSVGMRQLAILLSRPGEEICVTDLVGTPDTTAAEQPLIDNASRQAYRERIRALKAHVDDAEGAGDAELAAYARGELGWLLDELERTTGLGGRARPFAGPRERARTSVQKAIRRALESIADADPAIGRHLARTVVTGARCCYRVPTSPLV